MLAFANARKRKDTLVDLGLWRNRESEKNVVVILAKNQQLRCVFALAQAEAYATGRRRNAAAD